MAKHKHNGAVAVAARHAGAALSLMEASQTALIEVAARVVAKQVANGTTRSLQAVSANGEFKAVIKHGNTVMQFENDSFAVSTHD